MQQVFPDYYKYFQCIAGACRHSCCIGWEIDIDPDTASFYQALPGEFGDKLRQNISDDDPPHFVLAEQERCPFLNQANLCDIILTLGEEHICGICTDHPRFRNELPGRVETGLGLCCEEAARLILSQESPVVLEISGPAQFDDPILALRDQAISLLQDRSCSIPQRVSNMLTLCQADSPSEDIGQWAEFFLGLERLDEAWTAVLQQLLDQWDSADLSGFEQYMSCRKTEYEQFLVYLVYRHLGNAYDQASLSERAAFAALSYLLLHRIGAVFWTQTGQFSFEQQVELARMFSSEIEYSQDNMDLVLEELAFSCISPT